MIFVIYIKILSKFLNDANGNSNPKVKAISSLSNKI